MNEGGSRAGTGVLGAASGPARLLLITALYPTPDLPVAGTFVEQRVRELRRTGVSVEVVAARTYRGSAFLRYALLAARGILPTRRVDGVEAHVLLPAGAIGIVAAARLRVPCLVYAHGSDVSQTAWRHPALTAAARLVVRRAAAVVANSEATAAWVARLGGRARVVSPGIDLARFAPGPSERAALGLAAGRLALFVGNRVPHKGADLFVNGVIAADGWRGLMIGDGPVLTHNARIETRRPVPPAELPRYYRSVDCVVLPSRREGLGLAAIEAAACGTPIVAPAVGGLAEIIRDGVNGVLLEELTPVGLARALAVVAARRFDPEQVRASVGQHDLAKATEAMADVWRSVLAAGARGSGV